MISKNEDEKNDAELAALQDGYSQRYGTGKLTSGQRMEWNPHSEMSEFQAKIDAAEDRCKELWSK